jgi:hypothetical protein
MILRGYLLLCHYTIAQSKVDLGNLLNSQGIF